MPKEHGQKQKNDVQICLHKMKSNPNNDNCHLIEVGFGVYLDRYSEYLIKFNWLRNTRAVSKLSFSFLCIFLNKNKVTY